MADFETLKEWVLQDWKAQKYFRDEADDDYNFVDGHQWTDTERQDMEANSRVPVVFNRVAAIVSSVAGSEINNRTEVRFIPREIGDAKPNEILTAGAEWFRDQAGAEDDESASFRDMLICGIGWTETSMDFEADEEGHPEVTRIDPVEMFFDSHARKPGLIDAARVGRVHEMKRSDAEDMFDEVSPYELDADWLVGKGDETSEEDVAGDEYRDDLSGMDMGELKDTVRIVQVQYRYRQRVVQYIEPQTGQREEMPAEDWARITKDMDDLMIPPHRTVTRKRWKQAYLGKSILMENEPDPMGPTFTPMTGNWDRKEKRFYGLLRSMRDPQKYANKWLSQSLHIIGANSKGGVIVEEDAVSDPREFEDSFAAADSVSYVRPGKMGGIQPKPGVQMPAALMNLTEFAISSIRDVSGVSMELMGMRESNQPGILEYQRTRASMNTLAKYFDSLRQYRKAQGEIILHFLREHIAPTGRLVRIMREGQEQYVPLAMDEGTRKYDVIVDDAPSAPNEKEKAWSVIQAMLPMLQNAGLDAEDWADILEYSPLPASFTEKVRAKIEQQRNQGPSPQEQMAMQQAQLEMAKTQSEIVENQANAALDAAKVQELNVKTQLAPLDTIADLTKPFEAGRMPNI